MNVKHPSVNTSCPLSGAQPLDAPANLTYVYVSSQTAPDAWMKACCAPNPVHYVGACTEWCEVPGSDTGGNNKDHKASDIFDAFEACAYANGRNNSYSDGTGLHIAGAAPALGLRMGVVLVVVVAVSGFLL